ncbi:MAG TPA: TatD family hydrolase [Flavitalea sp.]|nr:TatD family hydrolase [Flavitalea sp.]
MKKVPFLESMKEQMIDTHCHLYAEGLLEQADEIIDRAREKGISQFYLPAIDSSTHEGMVRLESRYPSVCFAMMGLHPCSVDAGFRDELAVVKGWLDKRRFVAIGEIGLDYYWSTEFKAEQQEAFRVQIDWALGLGLPIVIHTRNAMDDTISIVEENVAKGLRGIFHCFSGTAAEAERILSTGFHFGIGGVLTYKNSGLAEAIQSVPLERIVLETDAPYLSPVPFRGKQNESSYLVYVAGKLAELKGVPIAEIARITSLNAQNIFGS